MLLTILFTCSIIIKRPVDDQLDHRLGAGLDCLKEYWFLKPSTIIFYYYDNDDHCVFSYLNPWNPRNSADLKDPNIAMTTLLQYCIVIWKSWVSDVWTFFWKAVSRIVWQLEFTVIEKRFSRWLNGRKETSSGWPLRL